MLPSARPAALAMSAIVARSKPFRAKITAAAARICDRRVLSRRTLASGLMRGIGVPCSTMNECSLIIDRGRAFVYGQDGSIATQTSPPPRFPFGGQSQISAPYLDRPFNTDAGEAVGNAWGTPGVISLR